MRDYEAKSIGCHIFMYGESYEELLEAISKWWATVEAVTKCIDSIVFIFDDKDDTITAEVHWSFVTKEQAEIIDELANLPTPIGPVDEEKLSKS